MARFIIPIDDESEDPEPLLETSGFYVRTGEGMLVLNETGSFLFWRERSNAQAYADELGEGAHVVPPELHEIAAAAARRKPRSNGKPKTDAEGGATPDPPKPPAKKTGRAK